MFSQFNCSLSQGFINGFWYQFVDSCIKESWNLFSTIYFIQAYAKDFRSLARAKGLYKS